VQMTSLPASFIQIVTIENFSGERKRNHKSDNSDPEKEKVSPSSSHAARVVDSTASRSAVDT